MKVRENSDSLSVKPGELFVQITICSVLVNFVVFGQKTQKLLYNF